MPASSTLARALLLALALLASACQRGGNAGGGAPAAGPPEMPPTLVEAATVEQQIVRDLFRAVGTVEARDAIMVASEIDGRIVNLPFAEGERVAAGQALVRLDDAQIRAELDRALALLEQARLDASRMESLVSQSISPEQSRDQTRATLRVAEAEVAVQRARLDKTVLRAPYAGVVGTRRVSPGAYVRAGDVVTELSAIDTIRIAFSVPERLLGQLANGAEVTITTPAFPGVSLTGRVSVVDPMIDQATRSARVLATASNRDGLFKPGMSATVDVLLAQRPDALTIPAEAVFAQGTQSLVHVIGADGTVQPRPIVIGTRLADVVEVSEGLQAGERVVRAGHQKLYPGAKVSAVDMAAPADGAPAGGGAGR